MMINLQKLPFFADSVLSKIEQHACCPLSAARWRGVHWRESLTYAKSGADFIISARAIWSPAAAAMWETYRPSLSVYFNFAPLAIRSFGIVGFWWFRLAETIIGVQPDLSGLFRAPMALGDFSNVSRRIGAPSRAAIQSGVRPKRSQRTGSAPKLIRCSAAWKMK